MVEAHNHARAYARLQAGFGSGWLRRCFDMLSMLALDRLPSVLLRFVPDALTGDRWVDVRITS
jgi:hypothetical protein